MKKSYLLKAGVATLSLALSISSISSTPVAFAANDTLLIATNTQENVIKISSQADFEAIENDMFGNYELTKNLVFSSDYKPIGSIDNQFHGTFNGNGHTITLNIDSDSDYTGLFASISGARVKNLKIKGNVKGESFVGALTGFAWESYVYDITNYANVEATCFGGGVIGMTMYGELANAENYGDVHCELYQTGGIVGDINVGSVVHDCTNYGDISSDMESFNLNDFAMVGGICGLSEYGIIYNTVNKGTITSNGFGVGGIAGGVGINTELQDDTYYGRVYNSYNTGNISGKSYVGGINGGNTHGWIENCVNTGNISHTLNVGQFSDCNSPISGDIYNFKETEHYNNFYKKSSALKIDYTKYSSNSSSFANPYGKLTSYVKVGKGTFKTLESSLNAWVQANKNMTICAGKNDALPFENHEYIIEMKPAKWVVQKGELILDLTGKKTSTYKVTYNLNGGKNNSNNKATYKNTAAVTLKNPTRKGYTFDGWYTDANFKTKIKTIAKGNVAPVKVYAKWIKK